MALYCFVARYHPNICTMLSTQLLNLAFSNTCVRHFFSGFSLIFSWFFLLIVAIAFWIFRMLSITSFRDFLVFDNAKTAKSAWNLFYSSAAYTSRAKRMLFFTINWLPIWRVTYFRAWRFMTRFWCCWDFSELGFARIPVSFC